MQMNENIAAGKSEKISLASLIEHQFWVLHYGAPTSPAYNMPSVILIEGELNIAALNNAINVLLCRHDILRSTYDIDRNGMLVRRVASWQPVHLTETIVEPSDMAATGESVLEKAILEEIRRPFDLASGPVIRFNLFRSKEQRALVITVHHIVFDLNSKDIFASELQAEYRSHLSQSASEYDKPAGYEMFSEWQREWMGSPSSKKQEDAWIQHLENADSKLTLPVETSGGDKAAAIARPFSLKIEAKLTNKVRSICQKEKINTFVVLLTAWSLTLASLSGQSRLCIGIPMTNRRKEEFKRTIGCFINILPLPLNLSDNPTFRETLRRVRMALLMMHRMQEMPYYHLVQLMRHAKRSIETHNANPLFQTAFTFEHPMNLQLEGLQTKPAYIHGGGSQLLFATFWDHHDSMDGMIKYDSALFNSAAIEKIGVKFLDMVEEICSGADRTTGIFASASGNGIGAEKSSNWEAGRDRQVMAISATFTAEAVQEFCEFWFQRLNWQYLVRFASFNQVFQELLNPSSLLRRNQRGHNVLLVRLEDFLERYSSSSVQEKQDRVPKLLQELQTAISEAARSMAVPLCFVLCPPSPQGEALHQQHGTDIKNFLNTLRSLPAVTVLTHSDISLHYPVADYHESLGETLGRIPYKRPYLAALATSVIRSLHALSRPPVKAIVLDCDNTLWSGVAAEDGATTVVVGPVQRKFQQFLLAQHKAGVVLCLCSKNSDRDVWAVFDQHPDMLLKREHISFWKVNWEPKSANMRALAAEMNIGLDAVAFLDDNPVERAEVRLHCPAALCPDLPESWEERIRMLEHLWLLDHTRVTAEDLKRQEHYRSEQQRADLQEQAGSFSQFLEKLELTVELGMATLADYDRLSQLSIRTNQFNTTALRLTPKQMEDYAGPGRAVHYAKVRDRFGDYGLVGGMLTRAEREVLSVEGLFLSCRALGRGVEHRMAAYLGSIARQEGCAEVLFGLTATDRNEPARNYLARLGRLSNGKVNGAGILVSVEGLASIKDQPFLDIDEGIGAAALPGSPKGTPAPSPDRECMLAIAEELHSLDAVVQSVDRMIQDRRARAGMESVVEPAVLPSTETEQAIAEVWKRVLGMTQVSREINFFEAGGTSLLMARVAIEMGRDHGREVSLMDLFQYPTIAGLARHLEGTAQGNSGLNDTATNALRQREALHNQLPAAFQRLKQMRR